MNCRLLLQLVRFVLQHLRSIQFLKCLTELIPLIISDAFSAIMIVGAFVFPDVIVGITEASTILKPLTPFTLKQKQMWNILLQEFPVAKIYGVRFTEVSTGNTKPSI